MAAYQKFMTQLNDDKIKSLFEKVITYSGISMSMGLVYIGQKIGLFKAMAGAGSLTSQEIASRSGTVERYVREWLINQVASGFVEYDPKIDNTRFRLNRHCCCVMKIVLIT